MGDLQAWPPLANVGSLEEVCHPLQPHQLPVNPDPSVISAVNWQVAEKATQDVLRCIQPTVVSEHRRKSVVEYVQNLLKRCIGTEVFPFGSVPLKTYLPDGDIDLTAIGYPNSEDALANDVWSVLDGEERFKDAEFSVKDVQCINAEVKLVKCVVDNIVVDISFNQIGGLCTLCFLEKVHIKRAKSLGSATFKSKFDYFKVDRKIGKDHLFKRSIILIKAWCYYESRVLGAHHGLISTYALETLVLYVFHLFHKSLDGPLAVLYRFLDLYSKFEWDKHCVSLQGLVSVSSLPELVVVDMANSNASDLLFSNAFIKECVEKFSAPSRFSETSSKVFSKKHLNIVDPLKQNNNLGRSVSKGNFYRIRSAFTYGARKLGRILQLPMENIASEIGTFFTSTLERHGTGERPDVLSASINSSDELERHGTGERPDVLSASPYSSDDLHTSTTTKSGLNGDVPVKDLDSDCREPASLEALDLTVVDSSASSSHDQIGDSPSEDASRAQHLFFYTENGSKDVILDTLNLRDATSKDTSLSKSKVPREEIYYETELLGTNKLWLRTNSMPGSTGSIHGSSRISWNSKLSEHSVNADFSSEDNGNTRNPKCGKLSDLIGEFDLHDRNLRYALESQGQEYFMNQYIVHVRGLSPQYQKQHSWNGIHHRSIYPHMAPNHLIPASPFSPTAYPMNQSMITGVYCAKDVQKRGTGTYFPDPNSRSYKERQSPGRRKNPVSPNHLSRSRNNGRLDGQQDRNLLEEGNDEPLSQPHSPVYCVNDHGKPALLDAPQSQHSRPGFRGISNANDSVHQLNGKLEFGSLGPVPLRVSLEQSSRHESTSPSQHNAPTIAVNQRPSLSIKCERTIQPYQLKDEDDFPPLSG
ncbi:uncharacterized protein LOC122023577 isoform X1 [Zingiber officinale]|uniref:uncharacterized protein LOC122023577 isoform X1 n=1 Tax=Zingiber officinale TaxID=94328 RepID=UPI001C4DAE89|nr:uncharacterized protein LOC122023577 isoform X1 [Zingiber officinale]